jgi:hypothetical protein
VHVRILHMRQQADEFPPAQEMQVPASKTGWPKVNIRFFKEKGNNPPWLVKPTAKAKTVQNCSYRDA